jgi:hypothetical protein
MRKKIVLLTIILAFLGVLFVLTMSNSITPDGDRFLVDELNELEQQLSERDRINPDVSKVDVAWHIDHTLKTINRIYDSLHSSDPSKYKWRPNVGRTFVFTSGSIPRGRGKSPSVVVPPDTITTENILHQLETARKKMRTINALEPKSNFTHPYFGQLNRNDSKKFIQIHTIHHLKIIRDILKD